MVDCFNVRNTNLSGKAAISHASTDGSNGMGNNVYYGHVKLSNEYAIPVGGALEGTIPTFLERPLFPMLVLMVVTEWGITYTMDM